VIKETKVATTKTTSVEPHEIIDAFSKMFGAAVADSDGVELWFFVDGEGHKNLHFMVKDVHTISLTRIDTKESPVERINY
jgi:hypothetical protein